jgi:hypothetical protein
MPPTYSLHLHSRNIVSTRDAVESILNFGIWNIWKRFKNWNLEIGIWNDQKVGIF